MTVTTTPLAYTVPQAARRLGISTEHAYRLARAGELPAHFRLGRRHLVSVAGLKRYLAGLAAAQKEEAGPRFPPGPTSSVS